MKIAVITGGGSGLGSVFLNTIRQRYPDLDEYWIIDIQEEKMKEAAGDDKRIRPVVMNLADSSAFSDLDKKLKEADADIRVLINNAGVETVAFFEDASTTFLVSCTNFSFLLFVGLDGLISPPRKETPVLLAEDDFTDKSSM